MELVFKQHNTENDLSRVYHITNEMGIEVGIIEGYAQHNGTLNVIIKIHQDFQKMGFGFIAFKKIYDELNSVTPIDVICASWNKDDEFSYCQDGMSTNLKIFHDSREIGNTLEESAFLTPTGKWVKKLGFTICRIGLNSYDEVQVDFIR